MKYKTSALFVVPTLTSAYHQNRVEELKKLGIDCHVAAFERKYYPGKPWSVPVIKLGYIEHQNYYKRFFILLRSVPLIRKAIKDKMIVFTFNLDLLFMVFIILFSVKEKPQIIYDVSDIRTILIGEGIVSRFLRALERYLLKRTAIVIVPSKAYIEEYFFGIQNLYNVTYHLIENKLNPGSAPTPLQKIETVIHSNSPTFTIGYFGLIRCRKSLQFLLNLADKGRGRVKVLIRGIFLTTEDYRDRVDEHPFIKYDGTYVNPDELAIIHREVDFSWLVHAHSHVNTKWSRIFRFYHAAHYHCPMIGQEGSQDGIEIERLDLGFTINISDEEKAAEKILSVSSKDILRWRNNLKKLPDNVSVITNEYNELMDKLKEKRKSKIKY